MKTHLNDIEHIKHGEGRFTGFGDVGRACEKWLMVHDPDYRMRRNRQEKNDAERLERRRKENATRA